MNNNSRRVTGALITLAVIMAGCSYAIYKHHHNKQVVGQLALQTDAQSSAASQSSKPSCYTAAQASAEEGNSGCIQFTGYAYTSDSGQMYLDQSLSAPYGFSVYIPAGSSFGPSLLNQYSGRNIDVTGSIVNYNGEPEIEVTNSSQITLAQ